MPSRVLNLRDQLECFLNSHKRALLRKRHLERTSRERAFLRRAFSGLSDRGSRFAILVD